MPPPCLREAQSAGVSAAPLLEDLGCLQQHALGDGEPRRQAGPEIDGEVELARWLKGRFTGLALWRVL